MIKCPNCIDTELKETSEGNNCKFLQCPECLKIYQQYETYEELVKREKCQSSLHFTNIELACKGCLKENILNGIISNALLNKLELIRSQTALPVYINSFYRCPKHNQMVGGSKWSFHLKGQAADIRIGELTLATQWVVLERQSFNGMGSYPDAGDEFIHVDIGERYSRWVKRKGVYVYLF